MLPLPASDLLRSGAERTSPVRRARSVWLAAIVAFGFHSAAVAEGRFEFVDEYKTPGLETELSGIYPHLTDNDLYYVITNGRPTYRPTMTPKLPAHLRNKLLTVRRDGTVVEAMDIPDGGGLFGDLKYGDGHLWLGPLDPPALWKLDLNSGQIVARFPLPGPAGGFEFDRDRSLILVQNYIGHPHLAIIDPKTGTVVDSIWSDENCQGMAKVAGDLLSVWTSSWEADAYSELWILDEVTGKPKQRIRMEGVHAAMAPLDKAVAGFDGFMTVVHVASADGGETVIRRYRYVSSREQQMRRSETGQRVDKFAAIQYALSSDPGAARAALAALIEQAARQGARYVVLPEHALAAPPRGATTGQPAPAEPVGGPTTTYFAQIARRLGIWLALSLLEQSSDRSGFHVTAVLLDPRGDVADTSRKRVLRPNGEDAKAVVGFARYLGDTVDDFGRRIGIISGDDLQSGVPRLAARGADTILVTANWSSGDNVDWNAAVSRLTKEFGVNIVVANRHAGFGGVFAVSGELQTDSAPVGVAALATVHPLNRVTSSLGLSSVPLPAQQPFSPKLAELGRKLFFDRRISSSGEISCASCHKPERHFADGRVSGEGVFGRKTRRNVPSLLNVAFRNTLQWDGNPTTIEQQLKYPLTGFAEMNIQSYEHLAAIIRAQPEYVSAFAETMKVAASDIAREHVAVALGAYLRTLISGNSAFDLFYYGGNTGALTPAARRGFDLFTGKAGCATCHQVSRQRALFTDFKFHSLGIGYDQETRSYRDPGVGTVSNSDYAGKFFTPSLRNVAETAPYMHDGSIATLEEAIRAHFRAAKLGHDVGVVGPMPAEDEIADLIQFLQALTGQEKYTLQGERLPLSGDIVVR